MTPLLWHTHRCRRYGLRNNAAACSDMRLYERLRRVDEGEPDPEFRADLLADAVLLDPLGAKLCYAQVDTLQRLVPAKQLVTGSPCSEADGLLEHFAHPPLALL